MAISTAVQRGGWVYVYDEKGISRISLNGQLHGFTSSTVSIKRGNWIYVYDEHGGFVSSFSC